MYHLHRTCRESSNQIQCVRPDSHNWPNKFSVQIRFSLPLLVSFGSAVCWAIFFSRSPDCLTGYYSGKFVYISDRVCAHFCDCMDVNGAFNCTRLRTFGFFVPGVFDSKWWCCHWPSAIKALSLVVRHFYISNGDSSPRFFCVALIQLIAFSRSFKCAFFRRVCVCFCLFKRLHKFKTNFYSCAECEKFTFSDRIALDAYWMTCKMCLAPARVNIK